MFTPKWVWSQRLKPPASGTPSWLEGKRRDRAKGAEEGVISTVSSLREFTNPWKAVKKTAWVFISRAEGYVGNIRTGGCVDGHSRAERRKVLVQTRGGDKIGHQQLTLTRRWRERKTHVAGRPALGHRRVPRGYGPGSPYFPQLNTPLLTHRDPEPLYDGQQRFAAAGSWAGKAESLIPLLLTL